jgi:inosose dehydratase
MSSIKDRIAAAPASWGICELPGWGYQFGVERVLSDMRALGVKATELGPEGFVPGSPAEQKQLLDGYGLRALGEFCPLILHQAGRSIEEPVREILERFKQLGADTMVIAVATGSDTYDRRPQLSEGEWRTLTDNLKRAGALASRAGVTACVHPHMGTLIQTREEVERVLSACDIPLCLDSGHLTVGGADSVELALTYPHRIAHVHLKDVKLELAASVQDASLDYSEAVRRGLYTTLGDGDVDLAAIVRSLEAHGYSGWYVPELDQMLSGEPDGAGPVTAIRASMEFLGALDTGARPSQERQ